MAMKNTVHLKKLKSLFMRTMYSYHLIIQKKALLTTMMIVKIKYLKFISKKDQLNLILRLFQITLKIMANQMTHLLILIIQKKTMADQIPLTSQVTRLQ